MKLANGLLNGTASGHTLSSLISLRHRQQKFLGLASGSACLYLLFLLLPENLEQVVLDLIGWSLIAALAIAVLVLGVRMLDGVLDL